MATLQSQANPIRPLERVQDTFGMFANDPGFDEIITLGREYREQANSGDGE